MGAPTLMAAGMQAGGGLMGFFSSRDSAKEAEKIGKFNAAVAMGEAESTRKATKYALSRKAKEGRRAMGTLRAKTGASGARMDVGAPLRAEAELAEEIEIDRLLTAYEGETAARRLENQAALSMYGGKLQAKQYKAQGISTLLGTGASIAKDYSTAKREGIF